MQDPEWRVIEDFPKYSASFSGGIRKNSNLRPLRVRLNNRGLAYVGLYVTPKEQRIVSVARIIAITWLKPHEQDEAFNTPIHMNGDRLDCSVENLMWRPLWFAKKYHQQLFAPMCFLGSDAVEDLETHERFESTMHAAVRYGLIASDISKAADYYKRFGVGERAYVWPTRQIFRFI